MASVWVVGPLGGHLGHGVASTIGGVALDGLEVEVSEGHPASHVVKMGTKRVSMYPKFGGAKVCASNGLLCKVSKM
jgi:hypothetical protein